MGTRFPDWVVRVRPLQGQREAMCFIRRVILVDPGHSPAERRSSLAHAIAHIDLEHNDCWPPDLRATIREEAAADELAARRLISLDALVDAIVWSNGPVEACEALDVDLDTLKVRGAHIHPSERATVEAALRARDEP